jgi:hypothetical protein
MHGFAQGPNAYYENLRGLADAGLLVVAPLPPFGATEAGQQVIEKDKATPCDLCRGRTAAAVAGMPQPYVLLSWPAYHASCCNVAAALDKERLCGSLQSPTLGPAVVKHTAAVVVMTACRVLWWSMQPTSTARLSVTASRGCRCQVLTWRRTLDCWLTPLELAWPHMWHSKQHCSSSRSSRLCTWHLRHRWVVGGAARLRTGSPASRLVFYH